MRVIITGASGMVGKGVLLECLQDEAIENVCCIVRRPLGINHPKLSELIHPDFSSFNEVAGELKGFDAAYLCMGVSSAGMREDEFHEKTYGFTLALAEVLKAQNDQLTCTYVSGVGTDSSEKGRVMWARVKGKTENDLLKLGFKQAFMFRPGAIIPENGIKSRTKMYQFFYDYFLWVIHIMKWLRPSAIITTTQIGKAMINVSKQGFRKPILEPAQIIESAEM